MNFKRSIISLLITTIFTTIPVEAAINDNKKNSLHKADTNDEHNTNLITKSGMPNHFDKALDKTTFLWAGKKIVKPNLSPVVFEKRLNVASNDYLSQLTGMSSVRKGTSNAVLTHSYEMKQGAKVSKFKQKYAGIEVFNREYNILMNADYELISASGYLSNDAYSKVTGQLIKNPSTIFGDSKPAIISAFSDMNGDTSSLSLKQTGIKDDYELYQVTNNTPNNLQLLGTPRAKKVLFDNNGELIAAHYVEIQISEFDVINSFYYGYVIDANNGKVLFKNTLTSHAQDFNYRIYADADGKPWDSPHGNVIPAAIGSDSNDYRTATFIPANLVELAHGPISTRDPWLADNATSTEGNNVIAYVDIVPPQGLTAGDFTAETTSDFTFDYQYDETQSASIDNNRKAAIVSLFSLNNYLHDDFYDHGFNEISGNAQASNYGRGGQENDPIFAEVQDYSGINNANMSTPADGGSPRMQMFLWDNNVNKNGINSGITVTSDSSIGLISTGTPSTFGPEIFDLIESTLVRFEDGIAPIHDACSDAINANEIAGKIVIIDRGECNFTEKVLNAQIAGAIGVIIANNRDGDEVVVLGGDDANNAIQTPNMSISENDGAIIYAALANNDMTVSMFNNGNNEFKDSALDNGIVAHEWGHYITNRLIGNGNGLSNNQGASLGEGWGDFHALLLLSEESDALQTGNDKYQSGYSITSHVASFVTGIRRFPYSTNMDINPLTFKDIEQSAEVHDSGEVWASMLWDSYVALINDDRYTFDQAQSIMKDYLVASYKVTPISPTFTEARDALLSVAFSNERADYDLILAAFARRGMGIGAQSPDRDSITHEGVIESFVTEVPAFSVESHTLNANYDGPASGYCSFDNIIDKGETGTLSFTVKNDNDIAIPNLKGLLTVTSTQEVVIENEGLIDFGELTAFSRSTSSPTEFKLVNSGIGEELTFSLTFPDVSIDTVVPDFNFSTVVNVDFEPNIISNAVDFTDLNDFSALNDFSENVIIGDDRAQGTLTRALWSGSDYYLNINNNTFTSDVAFETRSFTVAPSGDFTISWFHRFNIEEFFDGGVVEINVDDNGWVDVLSITGAVFENTGYNNTLFIDTEASIAGRQAFTGQSAINGETETINFGEQLNGNNVKFRFRMSTDSAVGESLGWDIDDITVNNVSTNVFTTQIAGDSVECTNSHFAITSNSEISQTANSNDTIELRVIAADSQSTSINYTWSQVSGTPVLLTSINNSSLEFITPSVTTDETLVFNVKASNGSEIVEQDFSIIVLGERAPLINLITPIEQTINENSVVNLAISATDLNNDILTYQWTQISGTAVTLSTTNTPTTSFIAPSILEDETLIFNIVVDDGNQSIEQQFTVNVINTLDVINALPLNNSSSNESSSGGNISLFILLLLTTFSYSRKIK